MVWQLQNAKNHFSEVVEEAIHRGPQTITRHGVKAAVLLSYEEFAKLKSGGKRLSDFLLESPLRGLRIPRRDRSLARKPPRL